MVPHDKLTEFEKLLIESTEKEIIHWGLVESNSLDTSNFEYRGEWLGDCVIYLRCSEEGEISCRVHNIFTDQEIEFYLLNDLIYYIVYQKLQHDVKKSAARKEKMFLDVTSWLKERVSGYQGKERNILSKLLIKVVNITKKGHLFWNKAATLSSSLTINNDSKIKINSSELVITKRDKLVNKISLDEKEYNYFLSLINNVASSKEFLSRQFLLNLLHFTTSSKQKDSISDYDVISKLIDQTESDEIIWIKYFHENNYSYHIVNSFMKVGIFFSDNNDEISLLLQDLSGTFELSIHYDGMLLGLLEAITDQHKRIDPYKFLDVSSNLI